MTSTVSSAVKPIFVATLHRPGNLLGGIQKHYSVFAAEAERCGYHVDILTPFHAPKPLWFSLFATGKLLGRGYGPLYAWWYEYTRLVLLQRVLAARVPQHTPSVIYAQDPVSTEAALVLKRRGYPVEVVSAVHFNVSTADEWVGKGYLTPQQPLYRRMSARDARVLPCADRLVFVSHFMQEQVQARLPELRAVPSWVVPNFVPVPAGATTGPAKPTADLITVGTLEPRKNQGFLLQVLHHAHEQGYPYRLSIVGDGPSRSDLQAQAEALGLGAQVSFLGAVTDAAELLTGHRAYVHAARMESFGIVLVEALAAGLPVFAAPVGGVPEVFRDGVEGRYWSPGDPKGAAARLIGVLETPALYEQFAHAARTRHAAYFSVSAVQQKLLGAILGTLPTDAAPGAPSPTP